MKYFVLYSFHLIVGYGLMIHMDIFTFGECFGYDIMIYFSEILRLGNFLHFFFRRQGESPWGYKIKKHIIFTRILCASYLNFKMSQFDQNLPPHGYYLVAHGRKA